MVSCVRNVSVLNLHRGQSLGLPSQWPRNFRLIASRIQHKRVLTFIVLYIAFTTILANDINKILPILH